MGIKDFFYKNRTDQEKFLDEFSSAAKAPLWGFFVLVALYVIGTVFVRLTTASEGVIFIANHPVPHRTLTEHSRRSATCVRS